ncbi:HK97 gp10 family phage protein [Bacillus songklensis]|uniref:HK97 gp10 family phage protein n=1 Tax=Bacillus songklensis TaxID=1069116 RepID=A0ABV8B3L8_9BACI
MDDIAKELTKQLAQYTTSVEEELENAKEDVTKTGVTALKAASPKETGSYAKGWTRKKVGQDIIVHNRTDYQLTHLLEHGHAKAGGGRVVGIPHIRPVEEQMVKEFEERVEKAIKS